MVAGPVASVCCSSFSSFSSRRLSLNDQIVLLNLNLPGGGGGHPLFHPAHMGMGMGPPGMHIGGMHIGGGSPFDHFSMPHMYGPHIGGMDYLSMLGGGMPRSRRSPYHELFDYGGGGGRSSSRYAYPYDMFDDMFDDDVYLDDYDDIEDPLLLWLKMQRAGGGRRGGRRGRYGRMGHYL